MASPNTEPEAAARRKTMLLGAVLIGGFYLAASIFITQSIAADCSYNALLGDNFSFLQFHLYYPFQYKKWMVDPVIAQAIPDILKHYRLYPIGSLLLGGVITFGISKGLKVDFSHGSASFARKKDINNSDLGEYQSKNGGKYDYKKTVYNILGLFKYTSKQKQIKKSGVVVGINPYTHKLMLHDGPEHILLMAPTRSGKGVNTIIPTGITWKASIFFFDPKGELWSNTAGYRKNVLHQKVMKFEPLCIDGSSNRWNPLAEINFRTNEEISDVSTIVSVMVKPDGEKKGGGDPFWDNSASSLLNGIILHLMYKHYKEHLPLPCPTDIMSFLSSPDKDTDELFEDMMTFPHITPEEFLEEEYDAPIMDAKGNPVLDKDGNPKIERKRYVNPLRKIYGEFYVKDLNKFNEKLCLQGSECVHNIDELQTAIKKAIEDGNDINWDTRDDEDIPYHRLLTHPRVAECAANMKNGAEQTRASIMQTAQTALAIYQDPVVQANTKVSDFCIRDLLDPTQTVSCYLVMQVKDIATVKPISRLFINTLLNKLIRDMKFGKEAGKAKKQRLLLMLDEFPQLGNMQSVELALAICAGYGIKMCIVCQDVNQLTKEYTKDNSIASNCHVHIYFTPNLDPGGATAKAISEQLGKKTIKSVSHSDGGGLGKGSDSISSAARELMTPDEVAQMSTEEELVFVAGHKAIKGIKLRYYNEPFFKKRTADDKGNNPPPTLSDPITVVENYDQLFAIHAADAKEREEKIAKVFAAKAQRAGKKQHLNDDRSHKEVISLVKEKTAGDAGVKKPGAQPAPNNSDEKESIHEGTWSPRPEKMRSHRVLQKTEDRSEVEFPSRGNTVSAAMPPIMESHQPWSSMSSFQEQRGGLAEMSGRPDHTVEAVTIQQVVTKPVVQPTNRLEYHHVPLQKESDPEIEELNKAVEEKTLAIEKAEKPKNPSVFFDPITLYNHTVETMNQNGGSSDDTDA